MTTFDPDRFWAAMDAIDPDEYEAQTRAEGVWPVRGEPSDPHDTELEAAIEHEGRFAQDIRDMHG